MFDRNRGGPYVVFASRLYQRGLGIASSESLRSVETMSCLPQGNAERLALSLLLLGLPGVCDQGGGSLNIASAMMV